MKVLCLVEVRQLGDEVVYVYGEFFLDWVCYVCEIRVYFEFVRIIQEKDEWEFECLCRCEGDFDYFEMGIVSW